MLRLLLLLAVALNPDEYPEEKRAEAYRAFRGMYFFGLVLLALAAGFLVMGAYIRLTVGSPPTEAVAVADFDRSDLQGRLNEVLLTGDVHWTKVTWVTFPTDLPFGNNPRALVALTGEGSSPGEPVRVLLHNGWLNASNAEGWPAGWDRIGVPRDRGPAPEVTALMNAYEPFRFEGSIPATLRAAGLTVTDDVVLLEVSHRRDERAADLARGYFLVAGLFMLFAVPVAGFGYTVRGALRPGVR